MVLPEGEHLNGVYREIHGEQGEERQADGENPANAAPCGDEEGTANSHNSSEQEAISESHLSVEEREDKGKIEKREDQSGSESESRSETDDELDEEDIELIEENIGRRIISEKKTYKRIKRGRSSSSESEQEKGDTRGGKIKNKRDKGIADLENLFDSDNEAEASDREVSAKKAASLSQGASIYGDTADMYEEDEDDMRDFIEEDDEADEFDDDRDAERVVQRRYERSHNLKEEQERPRFRAANRTPQTRGGQSVLSRLKINSEKLQTMIDIFGEGEAYPIASLGHIHGEPIEKEEGAEAELKPRETPDDKVPKAKLAGHKDIPGGNAFEPSLFVDHYATSMDETIKVMDYPERYLLRDGVGPQGGLNRPVLTEEELRQESVWISNLLAKVSQDGGANKAKGLSGWGAGGIDETQRKQYLSAVASILKLIREDAYEIPFIASNRKEAFHSYLTLDDLWTIYDLDGLWKTCMEKKAKLSALMDRIRASRSGTSAAVETDYVLEAMNAVNVDETELDDCQTYLHYKFIESAPSDVLPTAVTPKPGGFKRPIRTALKAGPPSQTAPLSISRAEHQTILGEFMDRFGLTAKQYAINIQDNYKRFEPVNPDVMPETLAQSLLSPVYPTVEAVLKAAVALVAQDFAHDPYLRKNLRHILDGQARLSLHPTAKGLAEIKAGASPYYAIQYVQGKPVGEVSQDEFLLIMSGVRHARVLELTWHVEGSKELEKELCYLIAEEDYAGASGVLQGNSAAGTVSTWGAFRSAVLQSLLRDHIYPMLREGIERRLWREGLQWTAKYCQHVMLDKLLVAPYYPPKSADVGASDPSGGAGAVPGSLAMRDRDRKILALSCGPGDSEGSAPWSSAVPPVQAVVVSHEGVVLEAIRLPHLLDKYRKTEDMSRLFSLLIQRHAPVVVAVSGSGNLSYTRAIHSEVKRILNESYRDALAPVYAHIEQLNMDVFPRGQAHFIPDVVYVDDDVAKIYSVSTLAASEFKQGSKAASLVSTGPMDTLFYYTVSVARRLADPLIEFASVYNAHPDEFAQLIRLHPYQQHLHGPEQGGSDLLGAAIERALIIVTNLVGLDINRALRAAPYHCAALLRYVCGLGVRKAQTLLNQVSSAGIERRHELIKRNWMGRRVFLNAASFLRIGDAAFQLSATGASSDVVRMLLLGTEYLAEAGTSRNHAGEPGGRRGGSRVESRHEWMDVLDMSRIHPENYELARKMAADALDIEADSGGGPGTAAAQPSQYVTELLADPQCHVKLNDLLLDDYAGELERRQGGLQKAITLKDIRVELLAPFGEKRKARGIGGGGLSVEALFDTLVWGGAGSAESRAAMLRVGARLPVQVLKVGDKTVSVRVHVAHMNGIDLGVAHQLGALQGIIHVKHCSDAYLSHPSECRDPPLVPYTVLPKARILSIQKEKFCVIYSIRPSDLQDTGTEAVSVDAYYDRDAERRERERAEKQDSSEGGGAWALTHHAGGGHYHHLRHPHYRPVHGAEARRLLAAPDHLIGDYIIRPSVSGAAAAEHATSHFFAIDWKVCDAPVVIGRILVEERSMGEDTGNGRTSSRRCYTIDKEDFDDLDEVMARYLEPMVYYVQGILQHPKYVRLEMDAQKGDINASSAVDVDAVRKVFVESLLRSEKAANGLPPDRVIYRCWVSRAHPGKFILSYDVPSGGGASQQPVIYHDYLTVTPTGIRFKQAIFHDSLSDLIHWWKRDWMAKSSAAADSKPHPR